MSRGPLLCMSTIPLFAALLCVADVDGQEPLFVRRPTKNAVRRDREGLPLPEGAIACFGSMRHGGLTDFIILPDGETLLTAGSDLTQWLLGSENGQQKRATPLPVKIDIFFRHITLSPNGKVALVEENKTVRILCRKRKGRFTYFDVESGLRDQDA